MNTTYIKERFEQLQLKDKGNGLDTVRQDAFNAFSKLGIPTQSTKNGNIPALADCSTKNIFLRKSHHQLF